MEQSSAVNENIRLENYNLHEEGVLLEETDGDKVLLKMTQHQSVRISHLRLVQMTQV